MRFLLIFFLPTSILGQELAGFVKSSDGQVIPYAHVYFEDIGAGVYTDADGAFSLDSGHLKATKSNIFNCSHIGYEFWQGEIDLESSKNIDIVLTPHDYLLEPVVVSQDMDVISSSIGYRKSRSLGIFEFGAWDANRDYLRMFIPNNQDGDKLYLTDITLSYKEVSAPHNVGDPFVILCELFNPSTNEPLHLVPFLLKCYSGKTSSTTYIDNVRIKLPEEGLVVQLTLIGYQCVDKKKLCKGWIQIPAIKSGNKQNVLWSRRRVQESWENSEEFFRQRTIPFLVTAEK